MKKTVYKNFPIFTWKHLWLQHRCFTAKLVKFLSTPILQNICERLLLKGVILTSFAKLLNQKANQIKANPIPYRGEWLFCQSLWLLVILILCFLDQQSITAQKMKFSIEDFFSKCDQIRSFLRISSYLLTKP